MDESPAYWVGPHFTSSDFGGPPTIDQCVILFADSVWHWQLDAAEELIRNNPHAGYATRSIVVSYFERIVQFRDGVVDGRGRSQELFAEGVRWVLGERASPEVAERLGRVLYLDVRNGLYHEGLTRAGVVLSGEIDAVLQERPGPEGLVEVALNPARFVGALQRHFAKYLLDLLNRENKALRAGFMKKFSLGAWEGEEMK